MRGIRSIIVLGCVLALGLGVMPTTGSAADSGVNKDLAAARRATARFHDVSVALSEGYVADPECVSGPGGAAMGVHYVNPPLLGDPAVDIAHPEILLYLPTHSGPRLIGLEYWKADADQNLDTDADRPTLFDRGFDGPMPGHVPGMPIHYDVHVWVWRHNPAGMFAPFNPKLECPGE